MDLHGIIPWRSCDFEYWIYHILRLVIITAQIVEITVFVILVRDSYIGHPYHTLSYGQISVTYYTDATIGGRTCSGGPKG